MRFSKKYVVFSLLLVITLGWKLNSWNDKYAAVETFRGANLEEDVFYPLMSKNINDTGGLSLYLNNTLYENNDLNIMLDSNMNPVASMDFVKDIMRGSIYRVDDLSVILQITDDIYEFLLGNATATKNGDDKDLNVIPQEYNGSIYIGLEDLCGMFGYDYFYDNESHDIYVSASSVPKLPEKFDLRDLEKASEIRNQGTSATCWACASLEALESTLLPYEKYQFSVDSMINDNSFQLTEEMGGDYTMALAYLLSWQGPTPVQDELAINLLSNIQEEQGDKPVHLQEAHFYDADDLDDIKWAVYRYGGVSTSIYASVSTSNLSNSTSYNKVTNSYCYTGSNKPNHDVVIIGWNDNYPASAFGEELPGDGAFICQNSWGSGFGDAGVFYISYYDTNIGNQAVSYVKADTRNKYNYIYQSDLCGWVGQIGYNKDWVYGANTYTATGLQQIEAAGFYALDEDTSYQLYFVKNYENTSSLAHRELVASGELFDAGYYTVQFSSPKTVQEGENFAVILYISSPEVKRPLAIEYVADKMTEAVDITDGKGFISNNGLDWECIEDVAEANLCLKAYGNNVVEVFE